ncbi:unnamed protein product [Rotaria sordida]|uniref:Uncharacterized protein n=2 Tax=Rotaria sordida TaxID=392033 RepID=A0A819C969_9BILA|nr:unnamed protein product [Rotaria sordida]CAF3816900.1 unnamed protein product [Rotaria sordida]
MSTCYHHPISMTDNQDVEELEYDINDKTNALVKDYPDDENLPYYTINLIINDLCESETVSNNLFDADITDIYANSILSSTTSLISSSNDYSTAITQEIYQQLKDNIAVISARKQLWGKFIN